MLLKASLDALRGELVALDPARLRWRPAEDAWCINEVVGHLIEAEERGFAGRIRLILRQDRPDFRLWDQPVVALARNDCERETADLIAAFVALRVASIELVQGLMPDQLLRSGLHPVVGALTVQDLLHE